MNPLLLGGNVDSPWGRPLICNLGSGVDSTALLIELVRLEIRPDLVMFANTGGKARDGEKPETYAWADWFSGWLVAHGFPPVTEVTHWVTRPSKTGPGYDSLEGNSLQNKTLPGIAFGRKSCSPKWKKEVLDRFLRSWQPAIDTWAAGGKVVKLIGYDAGPKDGRRAVNLKDDGNFLYRYPLIEWGWTREKCEEVIRASGLPYPEYSPGGTLMKSACFYCPVSKDWELLWLAEHHPDLWLRAVVMEDNARPNFKKIEGLWRKSTKKRPGSWRAFGEMHGLPLPPLPAPEGLITAS